MAKRFFRCKVCSDIHYGEAGPEICPTCHAKKAYSEVEKITAVEIMELTQ